MSLDRYVASLQSGGKFDSEGAFTLDQAQALEKLRKYQVTRPEEFATGLVASAVAAGAEWLTLDTQSDGFRLEHNGALMTHDHLVNLFSTLLVDGPDKRMAVVQELAFGLNALLALNPKNIRVTCSGTEELVVLDLSTSHLVVTRAEPFEAYGQGERTVVQASGMRNLFQRLVRKGFGLRAEVSAIRRRCRFSPTRIQCNGKSLQFPPVESDVIGVAKLGAPPSLPLDWPEPLLSKQSQQMTWIGLSPTESARFRVVIHGVSFTVPESDLIPGMQILVFHNTLKKDLSRASIVKDEAYSELLKEIQSVSSELLERLADEPSVIPMKEREMAMDYFEDEAARYRECWDIDRAEKLSNAVRVLRRLPNLG